uniref:ORF48 n=1 Tax=Nitrosopumilaceae spindle-shaped virus TaxID=3065433 RepID=A0AAT9JAJ2_9VIRU
MKLTPDNLKLIEHKDGHCLIIKMPDGSDNYLHCQNLRFNDLIRLRNELLIGNHGVQYIHTSIVKDETYYRIHVNFTFYKKIGYREYSSEHDVTLDFHSRRLNLNDAIIEYDLLVEGVRD